MLNPSMFNRLKVILLSSVLVIAALPVHLVRAQAEPIRIVATVGMVGDIVQQIGGDRVKVTTLMGAGVDPHLYKATQRDVGLLFDAQMIFYGGLHLEGKMAELLEQLNEQKPTIAVSEAVPAEELLVFEAQPEYSDPHIWFDVSMWSVAAERAAEALIAFDSDSKTDYEKRAGEYLEKLTALDEYTTAAFETIPENQRVMITSHDAFRYMGKRYGLEVTAIQGISTEAEAGAQDIQRLVDLIVTRKIPALFVESSVSPRLIQAVQAAVQDKGQTVVIGGELFSDAMGDAGTLEGTYIGMILHNDLIITRALGGTPPELPDVLSDYQPLLDAINPA